jgi:GT2 family glycosyltransferase
MNWRVNGGDNDKMANEPTLNNSPISSPALNYVVVTLNRYPELARTFIESIRKTHKQMPFVIVVRDRHSETFGDDVKVIDGRLPFVYAANSNLGMQYYGSRNVFLCNDDIEIIQPDFFPKLASIASQYPKCGIISPLVVGGLGNDIQNYYKRDELWKDKPNEIITTTTLHFPCVFIMRRMIRRIGLLDENFTGYGFEDLDYCIRAIRAGFDTMITQRLWVKHGDGTEKLERGKNYSLSFVREQLDDKSAVYFNRKYGTNFGVNRQTTNGRSARVEQWR